MAKLPDDFSLQAFPIESAISEGRTEDARRLLVEILLTGNASKVTQKLAAEMLSPKPRKRGRRKTLRQYWFEIGEHFHDLRRRGAKYEDAMRITAEKFCYSEGHVKNAVSEFDAAKAAHDEATRDLP
ncbi:hypothetical protein ASG25_02120 [Rhizobium sp. Leaf384]|nr:hypothetical protein ASG25_02120 [Rhizobium sp. Leaf384]KQS86478.1 hypothetical protein ASG58_17185 [Rhizobium sp. Leaf383]